MNLSKYKVIAINCLLLNQFLLADFFQPIHTFATEEINQPSSNYIRKKPDKDLYILGPGDLIKLVVSDLAPELNSIFAINSEGEAVLTRLNKIYVSGLTLEELTNILNKEYSQYIKEPNVKLFIINYRPVKFLVDGEVENSGLHVLPGAFTPLATSYLEGKTQSEKSLTGTLTNKGLGVEYSKTPGFIGKEANSTSSLLSYNSNLESRSLFFPTIIDALRMSEGITMNSDLTNIEVTRINSISNGGGRIKTKINLFDTIDLMDMSKNIRLLDGDTIFVPRTETPIIAQVSKAIKSNINPKYISILVGGKVEKAGTVVVSKSTVLTEALIIAGGTKALKGPITFLRYNNDGRIDRRRFALRTNAPRGSYKNPYMRNGDIIHVGKSSLNVTSEILQEITSPVSSILTNLIFFKLIKE